MQFEADAAGHRVARAVDSSASFSIYDADTWPLTEVVSWDDGLVATVQAVDQRWFVFEAGETTIRFDALTRGSLQVLDGSLDGIMATGGRYETDAERGWFSNGSDSEAVFARGDVSFGAATDLFFPPCIPFTHPGYVDGVQEGRELMCARPPSP